MGNELNEHYGEKVATYTFDAGPNAFIFLTEKYVGLVAALLKHFFADENKDKFFRGEKLELEQEVGTLQAAREAISFPPVPGALKYVIHTQPGEGPTIVQDEADALLDRNGQPKYLTEG